MKIEKECCKAQKYVIYYMQRAIVLQGGLISHFYRMGVMPMKKRKKRMNNNSLMELLTFGIFLLALLTFVFTFCR